MAGIGGLRSWHSSGHKPAQAQVKLEYKFPEGKKLTYKSTVKSKHVLTLADQAYETEQDEVDCHVNGQWAGNAAIRTFPSRRKSNRCVLIFRSRGVSTLTFDSTNPNAKVEEPAVAFLGEVFKLAGESRLHGRARRSKKGKGDRRGRKAPGKGRQAQPAGADTIRGRLEPDKFKREFEQAHGNLPDVLARPGEAWERTEVVDIGNGQTLTFRKKYEYVGTEKKGDKTLEKITSKATDVDLKQDPDAPGQFKVLKGGHEDRVVRGNDPV